MTAARKVVGLGWRGLIHVIWLGAAEANVANRAAELAFWFLLGFFPMLLCVTSMVSMLSSAPDSQGVLMKYVEEVLSSAASHLVRQVLAQTAGSGRVWFSLIFALWCANALDLESPL